MSFSQGVRSFLATRAATDPDAARLLEMFRKADGMLSEHPLKRVGNVESPRFAQAPSGLLRNGADRVWQNLNHLGSGGRDCYEPQKTSQT
jgi:hypothetical protein